MQINWNVSLTALSLTWIHRFGDLATKLCAYFFVKQSLSSKTDETDNSNDIDLHGKKTLFKRNIIEKISQSALKVSELGPRPCFRLGMSNKSLRVLPATSTETNDYIDNILHLTRIYARIFARGHYLFRKANSFPRAKLEEKCEL